MFYFKSAVNLAKKSPKRAITMAILAILLTNVYAFARVFSPLEPSSQVNIQTIIARPITAAPESIDLFLSAHNIKNLPEYIQWYQANMKYIPDESRDQWAQPLETLRKKGGDCEDLAFLNQAVLKKLGYNPHVVAFGKLKNGHVFTAFKINGQFQVIDNINYVKTTATNFEQIAKFLFKAQDSDFILELTQNPHKIDVLFMKKNLQS